METAGLVDYYADSDGDDECDVDNRGAQGYIVTQPKSTGMLSTLGIPSVETAPLVPLSRETEKWSTVDPNAKELTYNAKYEDIFAPLAGPSNPFKTDKQKAAKNMLAGFVEPAHFNDFHFESERRTFDTFGYARDPTAEPVNTSGQPAVAGSTSAPRYVGEKIKAEKLKGATVFESVHKTGKQKRKMITNWDPTNIGGYTGPWGQYVDEEMVSKPDERTQAEIDAYLLKKKKLRRRIEDAEMAEVHDEKSILHIKETHDYQGRSFMEPPKDVDTNLREDYVPEKCFIPKKLVHTYTGHTKGINVIRYFPKSAHMFLSVSMDGKAKLWDVYRKRQCIRTYLGHRLGIRDCTFNSTGSEFLTASFDRYIKLWDTETGKVIRRFTNGSIPYCVVYNPDEDKQHMFLAGLQNKKILQWDARSGEVITEYDRHLGPVNSITFFDKNRRFCSTSDDKSIRIWEWEIPVDTKVIQDKGLHSMPCMRKTPNGEFIVGQCMDNRIVMLQQCNDKIKFAKKKCYRGHHTAGYACGIDVSPDMSFLCSGDANGRVYIWDFKTHRLLAKWMAHDKSVCIAVAWHPHEPSKMLSAGWDSQIKMWD